MTFNKSPVFFVDKGADKDVVGERLVKDKTGSSTEFNSRSSLAFSTSKQWSLKLQSESLILAHSFFGKTFRGQRPKNKHPSDEYRSTLSHITSVSELLVSFLKNTIGDGGSTAL